MANAGIAVEINKRETFVTETRPQVIQLVESTYY